MRAKREVPRKRYLTQHARGPLPKLHRTRGRGPISDRQHPVEVVDLHLAANRARTLKSNYFLEGNSSLIQFPISKHPPDRLRDVGDSRLAKLGQLRLRQPDRVPTRSKLHVGAVLSLVQDDLVVALARGGSRPKWRTFVNEEASLDTD